jgi:glycerophosphoryl diester phosphodiesterase
MFTSAKDTPRGKRPQAIAHRGYKAANPENTIGAFKGAVEVGAHAIETDIHLSKDGVVVLSHVRILSRGIDPTVDEAYIYRMLPSNDVLEKTRRLWTAIGAISRHCAH